MNNPKGNKREFIWLAVDYKGTFSYQWTRWSDDRLCLSVETILRKENCSGCVLGHHELSESNVLPVLLVSLDFDQIYWILISFPKGKELRLRSPERSCRFFCFPRCSLWFHDLCVLARIFGRHDYLHDCAFRFVSPFSPVFLQAFPEKSSKTRDRNTKNADISKTLTKVLFFLTIKMKMGKTFTP